ncbi:MAG: ABC transporter permease [Oligoflexia bacterium]|nr:ABC transporter permease [Oligoflexia bacterium]
MIWFQEWILSGLRLSLPLIFAAYGGMLSERAGVSNIALEGYLLASAFAAAATMAVTHSLPLSFAMGVFGALMVGLVFCFFTIKARADQIITGMAVNLFVAGLLPVLSKAFFEVSGQTPSLPVNERIISVWPFAIAAIIVVICVAFYFSKTVLGLRVWAAGENPQALRTQGVSVDFTRFKSIMLGAAIASIGGIYLSIGAGSGYTRNMSAGRGYIALAALIFGRWKPWPTFLGCLLFGIADALQIQLQSVPLLPNDQPLPTQFVQALPYVVTLLFLAGFMGRARPPGAINQPTL